MENIHCSVIWNTTYEAMACSDDGKLPVQNTEQNVILNMAMYFQDIFLIQIL